MIRVILNGASGRMGREVLSAVTKKTEFEIVAKVDANGGDGCFVSLDEVTAPADVIVDFSHQAATSSLIGYATEKKIPLLIATTGQTPDELEKIKAAAEKM